MELKNVSLIAGQISGSDIITFLVTRDRGYECKVGTRYGSVAHFASTHSSRSYTLLDPDLLTDQQNSFRV